MAGTDCCPEPDPPGAAEHPAVCRETMQRIESALGSKLAELPREGCGCEDLPIGHATTEGRPISREEIDARFDELFRSSRWYRVRFWFANLFKNKK